MNLVRNIFIWLISIGVEDGKTAALDSVPVQVQVSYQTPDSAEFVRVFTVLKQVSAREEAEKSVDVSVVALNGTIFKK